MTDKVEIGGLAIDKALYELVEREIAPGTNVDTDDFWRSLEKIVSELGPKNKALLQKRDELQTQINQWHRENNDISDFRRYKQFLSDIGYLLPEGETFEITTSNVDEEISRIAGPQLVVPVDNARYALNAANARWNSLYDALYGTLL